MSTATLDPPPTAAELIELRQQAPYWRALHGRAVEREQYWKERCEKLEAQGGQQVRQRETQAAQFEAQIRQQATELEVQAQQIEALKAHVVWLQQQVFGRKSEATHPPLAEGPGEDSAEASSLALEAEGRGRGKQPGARGYGRQRRLAVPREAVIHELPAAEPQCPRCGKSLTRFPTTEDSEEIHWEVRLLRRGPKRGRYRPSGACHAGAGMVTAPVPANLIAKGRCSIGFGVQVLLEKFLFQRPRYRLRHRLALEGRSVSQGTLTGGRHRLGVLVQPLHARILERRRAVSHWQMDEPRWLVFAAVEGKEGHQGGLWVVVPADTGAYLLAPSRSAEVPKNHLGGRAEGIIHADRFSAYKALGAKMRMAFCWSPIRRDFVRIRDGDEPLHGWAEEWGDRTNDRFGKNQQRRAVGGQTEAFARADQELRAAVAAMAQARERELADPNLPEVSRKVLERLRTHWEGATLFVDHPEIPMDNNEAERCLRNPVVGRKNYYGSGAVWSGLLSALLFTLFQTCLRHQIDPQQFLLAFFEACARNGGRAPEKLDEWLPWDLSEAQKRTWAYPNQPPEPHPHSGTGSWASYQGVHLQNIGLPG